MINASLREFLDALSTSSEGDPLDSRTRLVSCPTYIMLLHQLNQHSVELN